MPRLSETPGSVEPAGPKLGEHTEEILTGILGLDARQLDELRARGVI